MSMYTVAEQIARKAHEGQVDKGGHDYILHPLHLASQFEDEDKKIVAVLHDVLEDSEMTKEDLLEAGIPEDLVKAVDVLTRKGETYQEYVEQVAKNKLAKEIKMKDLEHNLDTSRLKPEQVSEKLLKRYRKALTYLKGDVEC